jgi:hypothetical protein
MMKSIKETVTSFESLYNATQKCKHNIMWKDSAAGFVKNELVNCCMLKDELRNGKYKIGKYTIFTITEPKRRTIISTKIKDRVFQRSLCDNYLYQSITKHFIYDNCACQAGKGTDFARKRLKCHMQRHFRKHGLSGYVLQCDVHDFFGSTPHDIAFAAVKARALDKWAQGEVKRIIDSYDQGQDPTRGMGLGSQITQLVQLAVLDSLDHYIKERLRIKAYVRYADDFILIHEDKQYLQHCKAQIVSKLQALGLEINERKTNIYKYAQGIKFLGFSFRPTASGKIIMRILPKKVSRERRHMKKLIQRYNDGYMSMHDVEECFGSWKAHATKGNSYKLIGNMNKYVSNLWRDSECLNLYQQQNRS